MQIHNKLLQVTELCEHYISCVVTNISFSDKFFSVSEEKGDRLPCLTSYNIQCGNQTVKFVYKAKTNAKSYERRMFRINLER